MQSRTPRQNAACRMQPNPPTRSHLCFGLLLHLSPLLCFPLLLDLVQNILGGNAGQSLGQEEVAPVAHRYRLEGTLLAEAGHVCCQYDLLLPGHGPLGNNREGRPAGGAAAGPCTREGTHIYGLQARESD
jgi:hypothetical protein